MFPACLACKHCRQYIPEDGRSPSIYCGKGSFKVRWPLTSGSTCPKASTRKLPKDPIALEDARLSGIVLDVLSTVACALINENFSPQAAGGLKSAKVSTAKLLDSKSDISGITLVPRLGRSDLIPLIPEIIELLESLKLDAVIPEDTRKALAEKGGALESLYDKARS